MGGAQKVFYFGDTVLIDCVIVHFLFPVLGGRPWPGDLLTF
jgi:hypothetical protein